MSFTVMSELFKSVVQCEAPLMSTLFVFVVLISNAAQLTVTD